MVKITKKITALVLGTAMLIPAITMEPEKKECFFRCIPWSYGAGEECDRVMLAWKKFVLEKEEAGSNADTIDLLTYARYATSGDFTDQGQMQNMFFRLLSSCQPIKNEKGSFLTFRVEGSKSWITVSGRVSNRCVNMIKTFPLPCTKIDDDPYGGRAISPEVYQRIEISEDK